jgi:uncharacterized membrane protein YdbT with pleckstrin-like domain
MGIFIGFPETNKGGYNPHIILQRLRIIVWTVYQHYAQRRLHLSVCNFSASVGSGVL